MPSISSFFVSFLCAVFIAPVFVTALLVTPSSACAVNCGNVLQSTSGSELVCSDSAYGVQSGQTFQNCINCEISSTYVDPSTNQTDLQWLLYNLRYSASWCIFGYPNNSAIQNNPCQTSFSCGALQDAIEYGALAVNASDEFGYCSLWDPTLLSTCSQCLQALGNQLYLINFLIALSAGCQQRPSPGATLSLSGTLFSATKVNITTPTPGASNLPFLLPTSGISLGAKIGITIGGLVFILILLGCCIIWRGKRRRRAILAKMARDSYRAREYGKYGGEGEVEGDPNAGYGYFQENSPQSEAGNTYMVGNRWYETGTDNSPQSATGRQNEKAEQLFSPYVSPISPGPVEGEASRARERDWPIASMSVPRHGQPQEVIEMNQLSDSPDCYEQQREYQQWARDAGDSGLDYGSETGNTPSPSPTPPILGHTNPNRGRGSHTMALGNGHDFARRPDHSHDYDHDHDQTGMGQAI